MSPKPTAQVEFTLSHPSHVVSSSLSLAEERGQHDHFVPSHEIRKYTYLRAFWFGHFPRSGIESGSSFLIKCYIITVHNFFCVERFVPKNGVPKNGFPIVFSKSDLAGGGAYFEPKKNSEKTKLPGMCPSFAGNVGETQFHQCPFIPPS